MEPRGVAVKDNRGGRGSRDRVTWERLKEGRENEEMVDNWGRLLGMSSLKEGEV
jgi:hypothetical protein